MGRDWGPVEGRPRDQVWEWPGDRTPARPRTDRGSQPGSWARPMAGSGVVCDLFAGVMRTQVEEAFQGQRERVLRVARGEAPPC